MGSPSSSDLPEARSGKENLQFTLVLWEMRSERVLAFLKWSIFVKANPIYQISARRIILTFNELSVITHTPTHALVIERLRRCYARIYLVDDVQRGIEEQP
jgi:hypothetical protein